ncbi:MAG: hypothetical protein R3211_03560 [Balneolaceae bacterium]|nr:hypothetical protein [Balneolaceae bacterium]
MMELRDLKTSMISGSAYLRTVAVCMIMLLSLEGTVMGQENENDMGVREDSIRISVVLRDVQYQELERSIDLHSWRYWAWVNGQPVYVDSVTTLKVASGSTLHLKGKIGDLASGVPGELEATLDKKVPLDLLTRKKQFTETLKVTVHLNNINDFLDTNLEGPRDELEWNFYFQIRLEERQHTGRLDEQLPDLLP